MPESRYVVVDLNAFDEGLNHYIYDEDHVVLPHMIISDLANNKRREKHAQRLPDWLKQRGDQVWLAHDWAKLEDLERSPDDCIEGFGWRDDEGSRVLRAGGETTGERWLQSFQDFESSHQRPVAEDGRKAFLALCKQIGQALDCCEPELISRIKSAQDWRTAAAELIRKPILGHALGLISDRKYMTPEWVHALERFPDEMAFGRISRIMCWYSMLQAGGARPVQANDFEDTAYAHAASYTGYLATEDKMLCEMVQGIFPEVTILSKR
ncbi:MAG: hypothetical protein MI725_16330 [Pirellulales bacterium]|nr:hypothetical protein [Pirellulales bacterium]